MEINCVKQFNLNICTLQLSELVDAINQSINYETKPLIISGVNAYAIVTSKKDTVYRDYLNNSDIINIDGFSIVIALRFLGYQIKERSSCPDLFHKLLELAELKKYCVYFLGAQKFIVDKAAENLKKRYPALKIVGIRSGYFNEDEENEIVTDILDKRPTMLFLGMSSPKKDAFAYKYSKKFNVPIILGVGGVFDIEAGTIKRSPIWFQKNGMEWLFRLIQEPRRMWKRYLIGNIEFIYLVLIEKYRMKKYK